MLYLFALNFLPVLFVIPVVLSLVKSILDNYEKTGKGTKNHFVISKFVVLMCIPVLNWISLAIFVLFEEDIYEIAVDKLLEDGIIKPIK